MVRMKNESLKAFAAVQEYFRMGPQRSLKRVSEMTDTDLRLVTRWSAAFKWQARVTEETERLAKIEADATEELVRATAADWVNRQEEQRNEEWRIRCELLALARLAIKRWHQQEHLPESLQGIVRLVALASKLGRLAAGMSTEHTEIKAEAKLDVDWELALEKVYGKEAVAAVIDVEGQRIGDGQS